MDDATRKTLLRYLDRVWNLPNEAAKTHAFAGLLSELFPGTAAPIEFAAGVEKLIRIDNGAGRARRGRIDAYYGNAVIEFENSLKATEEEAKRQLREYIAGLWQKEGREPRPLLAVASDGVVWKVFRPRQPLSGGRGTVRPDEVELEPLRTLVLAEDTLEDFWIWLTSLLFRPARTEPSAERFRVDFGATSLAFAEAMDALRRAWDEIEKVPEARLAFETWQRYLAVTYGSLSAAAAARAELETLFLKHTYLACVARLLIWASLSRGRTSAALREVAEDVLSGRFFRAEGIENLVEDDFFQWVRRAGAERVLAPVWERSLAHLLTYDLGRLNQDVLKGVYQELVDPKDRHDLGEYYTPEWLCERIVAELLPPKGFVSVIDPTCGSGSFLRATIAHLLRANPTGGDVARLRAILDNVVGTDIHPLAVTISRATYLLALGPLVKATKRPIQVPVYLADSLFLPTEVRQFELGELPGYEIRFGDKRVSIAENLVRTPDLFDAVIAACTRVAVDHAASKRESDSTLRAYLQEAVPELAKRDDFDSVLPGLWRFTDELASLIRERRNSIWAFIIRNGYRPAMLRERFEFVIGNPPWLSYRYIADAEYQAEVKKRAVDEYGIAPSSQKLVTQMELATVFLVHALKVFGKPGARLGFVMPRSILTADQHANLRQRTYVAPLRLDAYWDLWEVKPVFNVPSCVVFATKDYVRPATSYTLPALEWKGRLPRRDVSWNEAKRHLANREKTARLIYLGSRTALSTRKGSTSPTRRSSYARRFRNGATIYPRNFYFVHVRDLGAEVDADCLYWAETDSEQARTAKAPYRDVRISGHIEGRFLFLSALSQHVLPFALMDPAWVVLPAEEQGQGLRVLTTSELKAQGYREIARWMETIERIWEAKRKSKAERNTVYGWLDYQGKLSAQNLRNRHLVLYNASGTDLSATHVDRASLPGRFVVDHKLYWVACRSNDEADYLVAILNSQDVNETIKPFQSTGLLGERDIHKKVLDLPIPAFDLKRAEHQRLGALGARAAAEAARTISAREMPKSLARRRAIVREALANTIGEIDELVRKLLSQSGG